MRTPWSTSTASRRRSVRGRPSPPSPSSTVSRSGRPNSSPSAAPCLRPSPERRSSASSARGTSSTPHMQSTRDGSPMPSSGTTDDGTTVPRGEVWKHLMSRSSPAPRGVTPGRRRRQSVAVHEGGVRMIQKGSIRARFAMGLAAFAIIASACSSSGSSAAPSAAASAAASVAAPSTAASAAASTAASAAASTAPSAASGGPYTVGISNPGAVGNGWREAMICSAKAQAVAAGNITSVTALSEKTDATGQLAQIRDLTTKGVNILLINPANKDSLNPAIQEALDAGIKVVAIDAPVSAPGAYNLSNDQVNYAYLGAKWLFEQLGGKGAVVYMRGEPGHPADTDRDTGFKKAMGEYPGITIAKETATKWDQKTATDQINDILSSGTKFDGVWTSGIDNVVVDALQKANHLVPIVGADNSGFVKQLLTIPGIKGAAVTNPPAVGGAGVVLGEQLLAGQKPADVNVHVTPELWDNTTADGKAKLTAAQIPGLPDIWPLGLTVKDWTTYEASAVKDCKGPGES